MKVEHWQNVKNRTRKQIRKYLYECREDVEDAFDVKIPKKVLSLPDADFDIWIKENAKLFKEKRKSVSDYHLELIGLIMDYECAETNMFFASGEYDINLTV